MEVIASDICPAADAGAGAGMAGPEDHINAMPLLLLPLPPAWGLRRARLSCEPGSGAAARLAAAVTPGKGVAHGSLVPLCLRGRGVWLVGGF